jgi:transposase
VYLAYLTKKKINGNVYYYIEECERINGKVKRKWQKYLGPIEKLLAAVQQKPDQPLYATVFSLGCPAAYYQVAQSIDLIGRIDSVLPKRQQGLSIGQYLALAAINRGVHAVSKRSIWQWLQSTVLLRLFNGITKDSVSSQRFWDNISLIPQEKIPLIWDSIVENVLDREDIDLSSACYDGTNFYTFIGSFNTRCDIAKRGKNKQGRTNLRQVNYALFCTRNDQFPLYFDVYEGNRHDAKEFGSVIEQFMNRFKARKLNAGAMTIVFDKGNNSPENFESFVHTAPFHFVGSVKVDDHKDIAHIAYDDPRLCNVEDPRLTSVRAWRTEKVIYGKTMTVVVTYNDNLFTAQVQSINNEIQKCTNKLSLLQEKLRHRHEGKISRGIVPTVDSIKANVATILCGQHMKRLITITIKETLPCPTLSFEVNDKAYEELQKTTLGKNVIITDNHGWKTEEIILAYRSQYVIENTFSHMKDRQIGCWWPLQHWTDQKIRVHGLYCSITLLLRALMMKRVKEAGIKISMQQLHQTLSEIEEVVNIYPKQTSNAKMVEQSTITKLDALKSQLFDLFKMKAYTSV